MKSSKQIATEKRYKREIRRTLKEVEGIQAIPHPVNYKDLRLNLYNARAQKGDAVRGLVIQINLMMEGMLDELFWRYFLGYRPGSKRAKRPRGKRAKELDELLDGRLSFETKIRLARVAGLITKRQAEKLGRLNRLRNKCAHHRALNVSERKKKAQKAIPLLEYKGRNLFKIDALESLYCDCGPVYMSMFGKLLAR